MSRILLILALCTTATAPHAETQITPWLFDLRSQFDECILTPTETPYRTCQNVLGNNYTLRREITYALDACISTDRRGCVAAFNDAGLPAEKLHITTLENCTLLENLEETEVLELPDNTCIEKIAVTIEQNNFPTTHNTDISCGIHYIECAEITSKGSQFWEYTVRLRYIDMLESIPNSVNFTNNSIASYRYYGLLERQLALQIELAETNCNIQTVIPHWANLMDYEECMGKAYADMWVTLKDTVEN